MSAPCPRLGFTVQIVVPSLASAQEASALVSELIGLLDAEGLSMRGGDRERRYVIDREGAQATDADRQLVIECSSRWKAAVRIEVSDLVDLTEETA